jgi:hypothetical protein
MSKLVSVPRRTVSRLKLWVACSLGIVWLGLYGRIYAIGGCCDSNGNALNTVEAYTL